LSRCSRGLGNQINDHSAVSLKIAHWADDWRITADIIIFDDSSYVFRLFSLTPPYAERRTCYGWFPRDLSSHLVDSIRTNAFWARGDL